MVTVLTTHSNVYKTDNCLLGLSGSLPFHNSSASGEVCSVLIVGLRLPRQLQGGTVEFVLVGGPFLLSNGWL